jgi:DNA-directed RNA polymerase specialized sigma54-like protein
MGGAAAKGSRVIEPEVWMQAIPLLQNTLEELDKLGCKWIDDNPLLDLGSAAW